MAEIEAGLRRGSVRYGDGAGFKAVVFSQWTSFLDLLEVPLKRRGAWHCVRYM